MTSHKYFVMARLQKGKKKEKSKRVKTPMEMWQQIDAKPRRSTRRMRNASTSMGQEPLTIMPALLFIVFIYDYRVEL